MKIIPAVDIKGGKCVRLTQGKEDQETVYSDDPQAMAQHWDEQGAQLIHVVDLDGAFQGLPKNSSIIKDIIYSSTVDIQVGGGIRSMDAIDAYVKAGAYRVILGTIAHEEPAFVEKACKQFPGKIMIGIDAQDGKVAVKGWTEVSEQKAADLAKTMEPLGVAVPPWRSSSPIRMRAESAIRTRSTRSTPSRTQRRSWSGSSPRGCRWKRPRKRAASA